VLPLADLFERLFEPISVGPVTLKNRLQLLPHNTLYDLEKLTAYLERRARGGVGLVEVSMATAIRDLGEFPGGPVDAWPYKGYDEAILPHYTRLSRSIHGHGAKVFMELSAAGGNRSAARGPSSVPAGMKRVTPRAFDEAGIAAVVEDHAAAAKLLWAGGFDGVDLHATHGMLLEEFYSTATNRRADRYGGSLENRVRVIKEILDRVREETRGEVAVGMRIDAADMLPGGNTLDDEVAVAKALEDGLDFLNVDLGFEHQWMHIAIAPLYQKPGYQLESTRAFKRALPKMVVGAAGRIIDPVMAESILEDGVADLIGMTRALIADPDFPIKVRDGRIEELRLCLGDNQKCIGSMMRNLPMKCTVNPLVGREMEAGLEDIGRASVPKKVLVIGGGVAGLEAARVAGERGHSVTLYEASPELGGQLKLARSLPARAEIGSILDWYVAQLSRLGVRVELGKDVHSQEAADRAIIDERPDSVVVATGSKPIRDGAQAYDYAPIGGHELAVTLDDVLRGTPVARDVLVLDDSAFVEGLALSQLLADRGSRVELVTRDPAPGMDLQWSLQLPYLYERALRANVVFTPNTFVREVRGDGVTLYNIYTGAETTRKGPLTVVFNTGRMPSDEPYSFFVGKVAQVMTVGDCNLARREMGEVIAEAFELTRKI
jgi:2,4-dienoyl-CoA reductase-like NADH-dependent reductase (Old Yellow Enzyme family)/thioredoxin reductase